MLKKFCIVLFITIFCNGVAYSSTKANLDLTSKEQAAATEAVSHINHKIEPNNIAPDAGVHHFENSKVNTSANHPITEDKTTSNSTRLEKVTNQGSNTKNDTKTATDATIQSPNQTVVEANLNGSASNSPLPTPSNSPPVPVTRVSTTTDLPLTTLSDMSRPIVPGQSTATVTTVAVGMTTKAPVGAPAVVTSTPAPAVSNSTGNVILVHNSSTKAQENRFDGASFVGGIVLTIGLTAIGFIAFKYYKSGKIDGNYRSL